MMEHLEYLFPEAFLKAREAVTMALASQESYIRGVSAPQFITDEYSPSSSREIDFRLSEPNIVLTPADISFATVEFSIPTV